MDSLKTRLLDALDAHVAQRPGLDWHNYSSAASLRTDYRRIAQQARDYYVLRAAVSRDPDITGDDLLAAFRRAYSGRLTARVDDGSVRLDYCTGQYWPTEYRAAACAILGCALFDAERRRGTDDVRAALARRIGRGVQGRWAD